jgi:hypothetical protein
MSTVAQGNTPQGFYARQHSIHTNSTENDTVCIEIGEFTELLIRVDPILNPFSPGAGTQPPELAGRESILDDVETSLERTRQGAFSRGRW